MKPTKLAPDASNNQDKRILIVDDELQLHQKTKVGLERIGYKVSLADSGYEAIVKCRVCSFGIVLLEMRVGAASGLEILKEIKRAQPSQVVVMFSPNPEKEDTIAAIELGA